MKRPAAFSLFAALLATTGVNAQDVPGALETAFRNFTISPGISISSSVLRVDRRTDGWQGDITDSPGRFALDLNIILLDYAIPGTNWGLALHNNSGGFSANKQFVSTNGESEASMQKIGTQVDGYFSYIVPTLYYAINERTQLVESGKIGGGIGYGAVRFSGNMILAPDRNLSQGQEEVSATGDVKGAFTFVVFYALRFAKEVEFRVSVTTTRFSDSNYKYSFEEFRLTLSKPFMLFK